MLRDIKKLKYIILALNAIDGGANTIKRIHDEIGESESYTAKIIAWLRNNNYIDNKYNFLNKAEHATMRDVLVEIHGDFNDGDLIINNINRLILKSLDKPILNFKNEKI